MKKWIFMVLGVIAMALSMNSCKTGTFASEGGKEDMAYLQVISSGDYAGKTVLVTIDGSTQFKAKVRKAKQSTEKHNGDLYGIKPGRRHVKVTYNNSIVFEKEIFTTSQQTKTITL